VPALSAAALAVLGRLAAKVEAADFNEAIKSLDELSK